MKFYNIYEINRFGRIGKLIKTATAEQVEEFKNEKTWAKIYVIEKGEEPENLEGIDYCAINYEAKIVYSLKEMKTFTSAGSEDEIEWIEIKTYTTEKAACKRIKDILNRIFGKDNEIDVEKYNRFLSLYKVTQRYQTIDEV